MKKVSFFLISVTLLWGMMRLLQKAKDNQQGFTQREQEIPNPIAVGYNDNEIASFLRASQKSIQ